jgi:glyoxylase-like metal-dependent hydrolase (beta-lactamase superfamily II)
VNQGLVPLVAPTAIANSHPDYDHYEGLLYLFDRLWPLQVSGQLAASNDQLSFKGPFIQARHPV